VCFALSGCCIDVFFGEGGYVSVEVVGRLTVEGDSKSFEARRRGGSRAVGVMYAWILVGYWRKTDR
jgi:stringent starvation protein B